MILFSDIVRDGSVVVRESPHTTDSFHDLGKIVGFVSEEFAPVLWRHCRLVN